MAVNSNDFPFIHIFLFQHIDAFNDEFPSRVQKFITKNGWKILCFIFWAAEKKCFDKAFIPNPNWT